MSEPADIKNGFRIARNTMAIVSTVGTSFHQRIAAAAFLLIAIQTPANAQSTSTTEPPNQPIVLAVKTPSTVNELLETFTTL